MQVGSASGAQQVAQSTKAMNDLLKMSVDATQDLSKKMVSMAASEKVGAAKNQGIDLKA